jgi:hypothetical protein
MAIVVGSALLAVVALLMLAVALGYVKINNDR